MRFNIHPTIQAKSTIALILFAVGIFGSALLWKRSEAPPANPHPGQIWHDPKTGSDFCYCPPGRFFMGTSKEDIDHSDDQFPRHEVTIRNGFWIGKTVVAQDLWIKFMKANPSLTKQDKKPVDMVNWFECMDFIQRLNSFTATTTYRLPTEAEWEYACKADSPELTRDELDQLINRKINIGKGFYAFEDGVANKWGIRNMAGNVWQWCSDFRGPYPPTPIVDPNGPASGTSRIVRGAPGDRSPSRFHSFYRFYYTPDFRYQDLGLRLVLVARK